MAGNPQEWEKGNDKYEDISESEVAIIREGVAQEILKEAKKDRGNVPGGLVTWAKEFVKPPKVNWRKMFAKLLRKAKADKAGQVDYSAKRLPRSFWGLRHKMGKMTPIRPSLRQPIPEISVVVDTSGSMVGEPLDFAMAEVMGIVKTLGTEIKVWACDAAIQSSKKVRSAKELSDVSHGGGGTNMVIGVKAAVKDACDIVVLLTDGYTPWPTRKDLQKKSLIVVCCGHDPATPPPEYRYPTVVVDQEGAKTIAK